MLTEQDLTQISQRGMTAEQVSHQLEEIKNGFPFIRIEAAASVEKGIMSPTQEEQKRYAEESNLRFHFLTFHFSTRFMRNLKSKHFLLGAIDVSVASSPASTVVFSQASWSGSRTSTPS